LIELSPSSVLVPKQRQKPQAFESPVDKKILFFVSIGRSYCLAAPVLVSPEGECWDLGQRSLLQTTIYKYFSTVNFREEFICENYL
jgi:hypothetical protein